MNQPDFDHTKPNNLPYHVDNLFVMTFVSINTTSRAAVDALYGKHTIFIKEIYVCKVLFIIFYIILDLAGRPEVLNELYEEALTIDKECNGLVTLTDVQKMVKLDSFVKESLRHAGNISKHNLNSPYILNYNYNCN
jgi:predicted acyltransferase (DUF342 family)